MAKLQVKRGNKVNLPTLAPGELGLALDTNELFIGGANRNIGLATDQQINSVSGLEDKTTVFNADGSITETMPNNKVKIIKFNADESITEIYKLNNAITATKTIKFNVDGSITEVIS